MVRRAALGGIRCRYADCIYANDALTTRVTTRLHRRWCCFYFFPLPKALAGRCPSLSVLKVDACPRLTGSFLQRLAVGCPELTSLSAEASTG